MRDSMQERRRKQLLGLFGFCQNHKADSSHLDSVTLKFGVVCLVAVWTGQHAGLSRTVV